MALNILQNFTKSITTKLLIFVFFIYLIVAGGTTFNQIHFEYDHAQKRIQYELSLYEKILNPLLADALWEFKEDEIQHIIEGLLNSNTVVGMSIYASGQYQWHGGLTSIDKEQKTFGSYDSNTGALQETQPTSIKSKMIPYEFDITVENKTGVKTTLAQCQVYSSQDVLMRHITPSLSLLILNQLLEIFSLWFFFIVLGYVYLTKPLSALSIGMTQVKEGCYDEQDLNSHSSWRTELDTFIDDFKEMVSTLRKTDLELKNTQTSLQSTIDAMPSMILGINQEGKIFEWNKAMEHYGDVAFSAVVGQDYLQVLPHFKKFTDAIEQTLKTQKPLTMNE
ncbi:PAS domain-containing protein, partial [bacterium]|nr:PAS domain-containing protein [bacterium]